MSWSIKDYDATPANNTQINGIDIDEGCKPQNINNAQRQMMADLANSIINNPMDVVSGDANNAIVQGTDGKPHIPSGTPVIGNVNNMISSNAGNLLRLGSDGKLYVSANVTTLPWGSITNKPNSYTPSNHASTHLPGGSDPVTFPNIFKVGMIFPFYGSLNQIPVGFSLCNGQNGTPNLQGRFIRCVDTNNGINLGSTGGTASQTINGSTSGTTGNVLASHSHSVEIHVGSTSPTGGAGKKLVLQAGYVQSGAEQSFPSSNASSGSGSHTHTFSINVNVTPPYRALYFIMYTGVI